jgi:hypothetical protein
MKTPNLTPRGGLVAFALAAMAASVAPAATVPASTQAVDMRARLAALSNLGPVRADPQRQWTIVAYMAGDNNLEIDLLRDLNEMEAGLPQSGVEVIALLDRSSGYDSSDGDWSDTRVYRVRRDSDLKKLNSELLASPGELNTGDAATLRTFLAAAIKTFPARRYALTLSGHGSGWSSLAVDDCAPGSPTGKDSFSVVAARQAIADALAQVGGAKLELIDLDLCLMGQLEVAMELRDVAQVMIASEATVPSAGLPYEQVLALFTADASARQIAAGAVKAFGAWCEQQNDRGATMAAIDLSKVEPLARAFAAAAARFQPLAAQQWPALSRSVYFAENYALSRVRGGVSGMPSADLVDILKRAQANARQHGADVQCQAVLASLKDCLIEFYKGKVRRLSNGLAVYAPVIEESFKPAYRDLRSSRDSEWIKLLNAVHRAQKAQAAAPKISDMAIVSREGERLRFLTQAAAENFRFTVEGRNILWTIMENTRRSEDGKGWIVLDRAFVFDYGFSDRRKKAAETASELVDLLMPQYVDGRNVLTQPAPGIGLRITNGTQTADGTIDVSDPRDLRHARVGATYRHPSTGDLDVDIYFDTNWMNAVRVVAATKLPDGTTTTRQIKPEPDAQINLWFELVTEDGRTLHRPGGTLAWGKGLSFVTAFTPPGSYELLVSAEAIGGLSDYRAMPYTLKANQVFAKLLAAGGQYDARDLAGEYEWSHGTWNPLAQEYDFRPLDTTFSLKLDPKNPNTLTYKLTTPKGAVEGFVVPDTRGVPNLTFWTKQDPNATPAVLENYLRADDLGYVRSDFYVTLVLKDGDNKAIYMWDTARQLVFRAAPPGTGGGGALAGTWRTADGAVVMVVTRDRFQTFVRGALFDVGTYKVSGSRLVSTNALGRIDVQTFAVSGDTLVLVNAAGLRTVMTRVR